MAQLSRPYQIALIALAGLVAIWFMALRHHGESSPTSTATQTAVVSKPVTQASPATLTPVYKGAAPGVEGLTRAIRKAHQAVATSQQNAHTLEGKAAEASGEKPASTSATKSPRSTSASRGTKATTGKTPTPRRHSPSTNASPAEQVAQELERGKTVLLLFWNSKSVDDRAVRTQLRLAQHALGRKVTVHEASASQIGVFGQVTQDVRINETPTILIISPKRLVTPLIGLTDAFSIRQAVSEAR